MKNLIAAIQFITILPTGMDSRFDPKGMIPFFPVVGLLIGVILALLDYALLLVFPLEIVGMLDVIFLMIMTGALHMDGLADTADGLFSHRSKDEKLSIMKDSRTGVMGVCAVISVFVLKWGGLASIPENRMLFLALIPALSRCTLLFGIKWLPYGRPEGGTGHPFFDAPLKIGSFWGVFLVVFLSVLSGRQGAILAVTALLSSLVMMLYYRKRMGCITGDMLGAMVEVVEAVLFLSLSVGGIS